MKKSPTYIYSDAIMDHNLAPVKRRSPSIKGNQLTRDLQSNSPGEFRWAVKLTGRVQVSCQTRPRSPIKLTGRARASCQNFPVSWWARRASCQTPQNLPFWEHMASPAHAAGAAPSTQFPPFSCSPIWYLCFYCLVLYLFIPHIFYSRLSPL